MKNILLAVAGLAIALTVACSGDTSGTTTAPTEAPTGVPATQTPTQTPMPVQEWELQKIVVDRTTVTVSLHVFAGVDVGVTINGNKSTRVEPAMAVINFVFEDVAIGEHPVTISGVVGHSETASVTIEPPSMVDALLPLWLDEWVVSLDAGEVEFPPRSITRYVHQGEEVYYVVKECCDQFSDLLDADGNLIGHPDGGITGRGDGVTKFSPMGLQGDLIWPWP